jgi:hypothetical protein
MVTSQPSSEIEAPGPIPPAAAAPPAVVSDLRSALTHADPWVRLHAVTALGRIGGDEARSALVGALHDDSFGVHWAAANALAARGRVGVLAVLHAMVHDEPTTSFLHGATRVLLHAALSVDEREAVAPVLDALHRPAADLEAPVLAAAALERLEPSPAAGASERPEPWWRTRRDRRGLRGHVFAPGAGADV